MAISGTHVIYVVVAIRWVLDKFINSKKVKYIILISFIIFFTVFTGNSASCIRACIMMIMILVSELLYRKNDFFTSFCFSLSIILILNYYNIENIGMWLSFMCVLGMRKINLKDSFAVQIAIFPIILYSYNTISFTFFISNFFASFIIGPILIIGYICLFLGKILSFLCVIESSLLEILFKIAEIVGNFKLSKIYVVTPNIIFFIIYYIILFSIMFISKERRKKFLLKYKNVIICCSFILICILGISNLKNKCFKINFLDVSQGDSTLITTKEGSTILVDGGDNENYDYGENVVLPYLLKHKVNKLDYVLVSHFDSDHSGGLLSIIENLKVENIIIGYQYEETENFLEFLKIAKDKKINMILVKNREILKIDESAYFEFYFPNSQDMISENAINNNSIVAKLTFLENEKNTSILFTGDIESPAEEKLVKKYGNNLKSDILKVAHHGSKTSSSNSFLNCVNPRIALIGVGKNNSYNHPNKSVLNSLHLIKVKVFRTDLDGEITIKIKNGKFLINTYEYRN